MSANGRNRGYIGRNEITSPKGVINGRQSYLNEEEISYNYGTDWVRPTDWLTIPGYTLGEQVAYGLLAITDDELQSNSVGLQIRGNYTVDWGDGTIQSFSDNTIVRRSYNFNSISSNTQTSEGFRQVLIKVTPQSGANLTSINFSITGITSASTEMASKWLELNFNVPSASTITIRPASTNSYCKKVYINQASSSWINWNNLVNGFNNLESLYLPPNIRPTAVGSMFISTFKLKSFPFIDTSLISNFSGFYNGTYAEIFPNFNYNSATNLDNFARNSYFKTIPNVFECSGITTGAAGGNVFFFENSVYLEYIRGICFPNLTNCQCIFQNCRSLKQIDSVYIPNVRLMANLFNNCQKLEKIGSFDGGTGIISANNAFQLCYNLKSAPKIDLSNCTNATQMFASCASLEDVPGYTFGNNASLANMFGSCTSLKKLPEMDFSNIAVVDSGSGGTQRFTFGCFSLERFPVKNLRVSWNLSNSRFGFTALSEVFAGLTGISGASATLTITGNPGAASITAGQIAGATAKGWTIVL